MIFFSSITYKIIKHDQMNIFFAKLSLEDQAILRTGTAISVQRGTKRGIREELAAMLAEIFKENGWKARTDGGAVRQYSRLRNQLRDFLKELDYDV